MYILVEILHTEFQYISLIEIKSIIEIEKQLKKRNRKKSNRNKRVRQARGVGSTFCPGWCYQPGQKGVFVPVARPGTKGHPFCPGLAFSVGKPGQQRFPNRDKSALL